jgi:hypothetical protein
MVTFPATKASSQTGEIGDRIQELTEQAKRAAPAVADLLDHINYLWGVGVAVVLLTQVKGKTP